MFIGKQGNLIVLAANTREELENNKFIKFDSIEETDLELALYNGKYLTQDEIQIEEQKRINMLTMTSLDFINVVKSAGITDEEIEEFLNNHLNLKHQLQFCQNVYCGVAKSLTPVTIGDKTITPEMVEKAFIAKYSNQQ